LAPLLGAGVRRLYIANRSADKAAALAMRFQDQGSVSGGPLAALPESPFDLIINATAASVHGEALDLPRTLLGSECLCYDMAYSDNGTPFTRWAERQGARTSDGWGMLIEQAAESFLLWRGIRPDTASLIKDRR
jgi:shikimate dehydrogenase